MTRWTAIPVALLLLVAAGPAAAGPACPGDANGDFAVDIDDVVSVVLDFGTDGSANGGDVDGSGLVDIDDVVFVVLNFGAPCDVPGGALNDTCEDAHVIGTADSIPFESGATLSSTLPGPSVCGDDLATDVWFEYTPPCSGIVNFDTIGSDFNTVLVAYAWPTCPADPDVVIACSDDDADATEGDPMDPCDPAFYDSAVAFGVISGQTITVRVIGSSYPDSQVPGLCPGIGGGNGVLNITLFCSGPPPPYNDDCVDADIVSDLPFLTFGDTSNAATDRPDGFACGDPAVITAAPGVWYEVTGTGETLTASLDGNVPFDAVLTVYCGSTAACAEFPFQLALECAATDGTLTSVSWCSEAGAPYMVYVAGTDPTARGFFVLEITADGAACTSAVACTPREPPANDDCANAIPIVEGLTLYENLLATTDGPAHLEFCGEVTGDGGVTTEDLWFVYTAGGTGSDQVLRVTTCEELGGTADHDTDLVIYEGTRCDEASLLANIVACNDDDPVRPCGTGDGGFHSTVLVPVTPGTDYLIRLGGWNTGNIGSGAVLVEQVTGDLVTCATAPTIAPGATITVDTSTGVLAGDGGTCPGAAIAGPRGRWLRAVGTGNEFTLALCNDPPLPDPNGFNDTRLSVFCGPCDDTLCVGEPVDNAVGCFANETLTWCTQAGAEYAILVHAATPDDLGTVAVSLSEGGACADPECYPGDACGGDPFQPRRIPEEAWIGAISRTEFEWLWIDDLGGFSGTIDSLRWWGLDVLFAGFLFACSDVVTEFRIVVYPDDPTDPGLPDVGAGVIVYDVANGDPPAVHEATETYTNSANARFGGAAWSVTLPAPVDLVATLGPSDRYYLSIQDTGDTSCDFYWMASRVGDGLGYFFDQDSIGTNPDRIVEPRPDVGDFSLCVNPAAP